MKILKSEDFNVLNESADKMSTERLLGCDYLQIGGDLVEPKQIINAVNVAMMMMQSDHPVEYQFISQRYMFYLLDNSITETMATDLAGNIYLNVSFIWNYLDLKNDRRGACKKIYIILCHEVLHKILDHVKRGKKWMKSHNQKLTWNEMNIGADVEVNNIIVDEKIATESEMNNIDAVMDRDSRGQFVELVWNRMMNQKGAFNDAIKKLMDARNKAAQENQQAASTGQQDNTQGGDDDDNTIVDGPFVDDDDDNGKKTVDGPLDPTKNGEQKTPKATKQVHAPVIRKYVEGKETSYSDGTLTGTVGEIINPKMLEAAADKIKNNMIESGFSEKEAEAALERIQEAAKTISDNEPKELDRIRERIAKANPSSLLGKACEDLSRISAVMDAIWDVVMREFIFKKSLHTSTASRETIEDPFDTQWPDKRYMAASDEYVMPDVGESGVSPQLVNVLIDVSGSISDATLSAFAMLAYQLTLKAEYSGIRIAPLTDYVETTDYLEKHYGMLTMSAEAMKDKKNKTFGTYINDLKQHRWGTGCNDTSITAIADFAKEITKTDNDSIIIVLTDGFLFDTDAVKKLRRYESNILFCICGNNLRENLTNYIPSNLKWLFDNKWLKKVFAENTEIQKQGGKVKI